MCMIDHAPSSCMYHKSHSWLSSHHTVKMSCMSLLLGTIQRFQMDPADSDFRFNDLEGILLSMMIGLVVLCFNKRKQTFAKTNMYDANIFICDSLNSTPQYSINHCSETVT